MKPLLLLSAVLAAPALAQTPAPSVTPAPAKFDWKLRLTKGQTWTQTVGVHIHTTSTTPVGQSGKDVTKTEINIVQTITMKSEVLDATPDLYTTRLTYTRFSMKNDVRVNGKSLPLPGSPEVARFFEGASFTLKQAPDGRVVDVLGLEDTIARQKKLMASVTKGATHPGPFADYVFSAAELRQSMIQNQSLKLPPAPLGIGESYSYSYTLPSLSFMSSAQANGKRTLLSFDGKSAVFDEKGAFSVYTTAPQSASKVKIYTAMTAKVSGSSTVQAASGIVQSSHLNMSITGKVTVIGPAGKRTTTPLDVTTDTTLSTQF